MIFLYRFLTTVLYPLFIIIIYFRKFIGKEHQNRFKEKIFFNTTKFNKENGKKVLWFHAASIGEVQSIFPIIDSINEKKNIEFLITTVTLSSGDLVEKKIKNHQNIRHRYFPVDNFFLINNFLNSWKPDLAVFVDSEIWPNLLLELKRKKISSILINARITEKTFKRWMMISGLAKKIFYIFDLCLVSNNETKDYLSKLNAKNIKFIGNIKLAAKINIKNIKDINGINLFKEKFWCAASTHKGEEELCLDVHINLKKKINDILTVIIPRHISRSNEIKLLCNKYKLTSQILNKDERIQNDKEILIVNSFGELTTFFKYSKSVFMGKSTLKNLEQVGGQNPIEAAKLGCKIYHGPYVYNFNEVYDLLNSYKISEKINSSRELSDRIIIDLNGEEKNFDKNIRIIDDLGQKILDESVNQISKYLND